MVYLYKCSTCGTDTDIVKPVSRIDEIEKCNGCGNVMTRAFAPAKIHLFGTAVQEKKWQPALGRAATDRELKAEAQSKGWVELGTERPEKHLKPQAAEYPSFSNEDLRTMSRS